MRPIVSNIGSPVSNVSKWLERRFKILEPYQSLHVKNSLEVIEKLSNLELKHDEVMISFDVTSLYPSVPIQKTLKLLKKWLLDNDISETSINEYVTLTKLCVEKKFFQFNGKIYSQNEGLTMGNPLSPPLADLFLSDLETRITTHFFWMFKEWMRYMDDIFCVVKRNMVGEALKFLNLQEETVKFTYEVEENGILPFLDLELIRKNSKIDFNIYRKKTHVDSYIHYQAFNPLPHKLAAFNSLIHRLFNVPLSTENFRIEKKRIFDIAAKNGFPEQLIEDLMNKIRYKRRLKEVTTFDPFYDAKDKNWVSLNYHPNLLPKFKKVFKKYDLEIASHNKFTVNSFFHPSLKDQTPDSESSGIYGMKCQDCDKIYIGQTRRNITVRSKEHMRSIKNKEIMKSAVAKHRWFEGHSINPEPELLKRLTKSSDLNIWENIFIYKNQDNLMNEDLEGINNSLFKSLNSSRQNQSACATPSSEHNGCWNDENDQSASH